MTSISDADMMMYRLTKAGEMLYHYKFDDKGGYRREETAAFSEDPLAAHVCRLLFDSYNLTWNQPIYVKTYSPRENWGTLGDIQQWLTNAVPVFQKQYDMANKCPDFPDEEYHDCKCKLYYVKQLAGDIKHVLDRMAKDGLVKLCL